MKVAFFEHFCDMSFFEKRKKVITYDFYIYGI